jgi:hypothetical protein
MSTKLSTKPTADVVLHFTNGLEVHPADCPRGIQAFPHWQPGPDGRAVCRCTVIAAEDAADGPLRCL